MKTWPTRFARPARGEPRPSPQGERGGVLAPSLLESLSRLRFVARRPVLGGIAGERPSRRAGAGVEFADYRPYQPGDDIRHLDRHVYVRLGRPYVKLFVREQELPVVIFLDTSGSMAAGEPTKFALARAIAAGLAWVALAGGDRVVGGAFAGQHLRWSPPVQGRAHARTFFAWLQELRPGGETHLGEALARAGLQAREEGLAVVVSDWLAGGAEQAVAGLRAAGLRVVGIQVLAPEELEPERLGTGMARLRDTESGRELDLALSPESFRRYHQELETWRQGLEALFHRQEGLFFSVRSDQDLHSFFLRDLRAGGLLG